MMSGGYAYTAVQYSYVHFKNTFFCRQAFYFKIVTGSRVLAVVCGPCPACLTRMSAATEYVALVASNSTLTHSLGFRDQESKILYVGAVQVP